MNDLLELMERASADQPPSSITRESTLVAGRRALRHRRQVASVFAGVAAVVVAAGVVTLPARLGSSPTPIGGPTPGVTTYRVPQLPAAAGVPGAATRPDLVGTDPLLVHFAIPTSAWPVGEAVYSAADGTERLQAGGLTVAVTRYQSQAEETANPQISVQTGQSASPVPGTTTHTPTTVGGRPATLTAMTFPTGEYPYYGLVWQPVDGVWVGLFAATKYGEAELWSDVAALRLDVAQRLVVPFQLTALPSGARLLGCTAGVPGAGEPYAASSVVVGDGHGNTATLAIGQQVRPSVHGEHSSSVPLPSPNRTVNGHPVVWLADAPRGLVSDDYDGVPLGLTVSGGYDEATATQLLTGLVLSTDLTDPASWPAGPLR